MGGGWQDVLFAVGSVIFTVALVPSLLSESKPALPTSLITGSVLAVYTAAFASLDLWLAAATDALAAAAWLILALQVKLRRG